MFPVHCCCVLIFRIDTHINTVLKNHRQLNSGEEKNKSTFLPRIFTDVNQDLICGHSNKRNTTEATSEEREKYNRADQNLTQGIKNFVCHQRISNGRAPMYPMVESIFILCRQKRTTHRSLHRWQGRTQGNRAKSETENIAFIIASLRTRSTRHLHTEQEYRNKLRTACSKQLLCASSQYLFLEKIIPTNSALTETFQQFNTRLRKHQLHCNHGVPADNRILDGIQNICLRNTCLENYGICQY